MKRNTELLEQTMQHPGSPSNTELELELKVKALINGEDIT